jgi:hypothetical protein
MKTDVIIEHIKKVEQLPKEILTQSLNIITIKGNVPDGFTRINLSYDNKTTLSDMINNIYIYINNTKNNYNIFQKPIALASVCCNGGRTDSQKKHFNNMIVKFHRSAIFGESMPISLKSVLNMVVTTTHYTDKIYALMNYIKQKESIMINEESVAIKLGKMMAIIDHYHNPNRKKENNLFARFGVMMAKKPRQCNSIIQEKINIIFRRNQYAIRDINSLRINVSDIPERLNENEQLSYWLTYRMHSDDLIQKSKKQYQTETSVSDSVEENQ